MSLVPRYSNGYTRVLVTAAVLSVATAAAAQGSGAMASPPSRMTQSSTMSSGTQAFLKSAADGGQSEVELAALALSKTSNVHVKELAQTIKTDHETANAEVQGIWPHRNN